MPRNLNAPERPAPLRRRSLAPAATSVAALGVAGGVAGDAELTTADA